jgi:hypothetical protein
MSPSPTEALARAAAALVSDHDLTGVLADLLSDAQAAMSAEAVGLLVYTQPGHLELLTASSHATTELELFQIQERTGPCVDAMMTASPVWESGTERLESRWPLVGRAIAEAGYVAVHAYPLRWRERGIGALNVFYAEPPTDSPALRLLGQAFADMATLVVLHPEEVSASDIVARTERALAGRNVVEQAKGVIAYLDNVPIDDAYLLLRERAERDGVNLTVMAQRVLDQAARPTGGEPRPG